MSSAITNTSTTVANTANTTATGSNGQLNSQDFMKLLLTQLQQQDPTSPMDTDKMMTQTTQLSQLEAATATQSAMTSMTTAFQQSAGYSLASTIGHVADTGNNSLLVTAGKTSSIQAYFPADATGGSIIVKDNSGNTVKTINVGAVSQGVYSASWDGVGDNGQAVKTGTYKTYLSYPNSSGTMQTLPTGTFPISGIQMPNASNQNTAQVLLGNSYVPMTSVKAIY